MKVPNRYIRSTGTSRLTLRQAMALEKAIDRIYAEGVPAEERRVLDSVRKKIRADVARTCAYAEGRTRTGEVQARLFPLDIRGAVD